MLSVPGTQQVFALCRVYEFGNLKGLNGFFNWRRDRVKQELLMHLMHAMGVIRWVQ